MMSRLLTVAAIVCACTAAVLALRPADREAASLETSAIDLGECAVGKHPVTVRVRNDGTRPVEVNNLYEGCQPGCCLKIDRPMPVTVPPGGTAEILCVMHVTKPQRFAYRSEVWVAGTRLHSLPLVVRGVGTPGGAEAK